MQIEFQVFFTETGFGIESSYPQFLQIGLLREEKMKSEGEKKKGKGEREKGKGRRRRGGRGGRKGEGEGERGREGGREEGRKENPVWKTGAL